MKTVDGDLIKLALEGEFDVIIHGCNCFCTMGAGIAKAIKSEFPDAAKADLETQKGDRLKLGTYSHATVERNGKKLTIINAYSQYNWRGRGVKADYDAIQRIFAQLKQTYSGARFGYPLIGAGLAGGDWSVIAEIIDTELMGEDHTLVKFAR
ncbi:macro domain-containing protein [Pseudoalteromonas sp. SMS1]|uniref:macro domain-containing protein n=1 Tax=Pseudoalteromonas sp. SMS1 TaxID=2908894 RepID=UPI001F1AFC70|nr:macro domain-containing protein [Pseudoalteromonas sp. SMS1]MCF2859137.1 macro domain-containing protein [Pseudoalteromonas sp. SMS1]